MFKTIRSFIKRCKREKLLNALPFSGWVSTTNLVHSQLTDMPDSELSFLNKLLPWQAFTSDSQGRRVGAIAWKGKRDLPQDIDDPRAILLASKLTNKYVLEIGCFEGIHTLALLRQGLKVKAIDSRIENVVKTMVRANLYGYQPVVELADVDGGRLQLSDEGFDGCFHCGVLYHLKNPIEHLSSLLPKVREMMLLDTHVADDVECSTPYENYEVSCKIYSESGRADVFSGMHEYARWLSKKDLIAIFSANSFAVEVCEDRQERNGQRVLLLARRIN